MSCLFGCFDGEDFSHLVNHIVKQGATLGDIVGLKFNRAYMKVHNNNTSSS